jgi:hypothetical protein
MIIFSHGNRTVEHTLQTVGTADVALIFGQIMGTAVLLVMDVRNLAVVTNPVVAMNLAAPMKTVDFEGPMVDPITVDRTRADFRVLQ